MFVSLQIGRGLAAIAVAAFHLSEAMGSPNFGGTGVRPFTEISGYGYLGVDFFFVLSGFIILQAHHRDIGQPDRAGRYALRRFIRIYPIYWIYLLACIAGMVVVASTHLRLSSPLDWLTTLSLVRLTSVELPLAQAWTLFHEIVFYTVFAALLFSRRIGFSVLAIWVIGIGWTFHYTLSDEQTLMSTLLGAYNLNFVVGMLAYLVVARLSKVAAGITLFAGLALFAVSYHELLSGTAAEFVNFIIAISFGVILSGAAALEKLGMLRLPVWLGFFGDASYSIYLLHEHAETYALRALSKLGVVSTYPQVFTYLAVLAITVGVGSAAYLLLERPLLRTLRRRFDRPNHFPQPHLTPPTPS